MIRILKNNLKATKADKAQENKIEAFRYRKKVDNGGSIILSELPPGKSVDVIVLLGENDDSQKDMQALMNKIKSRQIFKGMSKAEIIQKLREDRELVWKERHAD